MEYGEVDLSSRIKAEKQKDGNLNANFMRLVWQEMLQGRTAFVFLRV